jgi:hypothetical protein
MSETVEVPIALLQRLVEAGEAFYTLEEEMEDFLVSQDKDLLSRLEAARNSHLAGRLRPFAEMKYPS